MFYSKDRRKDEIQSMCGVGSLWLEGYTRCWKRGEERQGSDGVANIALNEKSEGPVGESDLTVSPERGSLGKYRHQTET